MMKKETIDEILIQIDNLIDRRTNKLNIIENDYVDSNGKILSSNYDEYKQRKEKAIKKFNEEFIGLFGLLKDRVNLIRKLQPALIDLNKKNINLKNRIPRKIALGKKRVVIQGKEYSIPNMSDFPFKDSMYMTNKKDVEYLQKIYLRLLYALPFEKTQFYIYDSIGLGKSIENFNILMDNDKIFPNKKAIINSKELDETLDGIFDYIQDIRQNKFRLTGQKNWDEYNRFLYSKGDYNNMLPYKIFVFIDVPEGMNQEQFRKFRIILNNSYDCGILVLYSFNQTILEAEDTKLQRTALELKQCIESSKPLHKLMEKEEQKYSNIVVENIGEKMPSAFDLDNLLKKYDQLSKDNNAKNNMDLIVNINNRFIGDSKSNIMIPVGFFDKNNEVCEMELSDNVVHYLIGGSTGSGKSTFLHDMILSATNKYSPDELKLYLLDFKEAVEFNVYANPVVLPHVSLVATEADINYGISVLDHLVNEIKIRAKKFKESGTKDIKSYREKNTNENMPRIMLVIDEFQILLQSSKSDEALEKFIIIAKQGRSNGIHMVLCTQTLKGLNFNEILTQMNGRVVLKSTPEDSKSLFGSSDNNEEAARINKPYAIMNVNNGYKENNEKFKVAWHEDKIKEKIKEIFDYTKLKGIKYENNVYDGAKNPIYPDVSEFITHDILEIMFGVSNNYEQSFFKIPVRNEKNKNIAIIGNDRQIKNNLLKSMLISIENNSNDYEIIYFGENDLEDVLSTNINIINYEEINNENEKEILENLKSNKRKIIIFDDIKTGLFGYSSKYPKIEEELMSVYKNYSCLISFYAKYSEFKTSQKPEIYENVIGYRLNDDDIRSVTQTLMRQGPKTPFYVENKEFILSFRPFTEVEND